MRNLLSSEAFRRTSEMYRNGSQLSAPSGREGKDRLQSVNGAATAPGPPSPPLATILTLFELSWGHQGGATTEPIGHEAR